MKVAPVSKIADPVTEANQFTVPRQPVAVKVAVSPDSIVKPATVGAEGKVKIVAIAEALDALVQPLTVQST